MEESAASKPSALSQPLDLKASSTVSNVGNDATTAETSSILTEHGANRGISLREKSLPLSHLSASLLVLGPLWTR